MADITRTILPAQFERMKAAQAAAEAEAGVTGQTATSMGLGSQAQKDGERILEDIGNAGSEADGTLEAASADTGFLPAISSLGTVVEGASSFYLGWEIGSYIRDTLIEPEEGAAGGAPPVAYKRIKQKAVDKGQILLESEGEKLRAPLGGWEVLFGETLGGETKAESGVEVEGCNPAKCTNVKPPKSGAGNPLHAGSEPPVVPLFTNWKEFCGAVCGEGGVSPRRRYYVWFLPFKASDPREKGSKGKENKSGSVPAAVVPAAALVKAQEHLENPALDEANKVWAGDHRVTGPAMPESAEVEVPALGEHESFEAYDETLYEAGLQPEAEVLAESAIDTSKGPNEVTDVSPKAGTKVESGSTVRVRYNPADAPEPAVGGGGGCETSIPSVDFSPLNLPLSEKFPFGIVAFFSGWIGEWETGASAPEFDLHIIGSLTIHVALAWLSGTLEYVRLALVFATFVGFLWFLGTAGMKLQGDSS